jgi:hypothetical protein
MRIAAEPGALQEGCTAQDQLHCPRHAAGCSGLVVCMLLLHAIAGSRAAADLL